MANKIVKGSALAGFVALVAVMGVVAAGMDGHERPMSNASLANLDLDDQLKKVDHIAVGVVVEVVKPYEDVNAHPEVPRYFGDVVFAVEQDLLDTIDEDLITLRTQHNVKQTPAFEEGERALLFLIPGQPGSVEGEGVYVVSGMYQGKYKLDPTTEKYTDPKYDAKSYLLSDIKAKLADMSE